LNAVETSTLAARSYELRERRACTRTDFILSQSLGESAILNSARSNRQSPDRDGSEPKLFAE
jgi:hypothetical protein